MRRYFKNLIRAVLNINPYKAELDELRDHYEKAAENVQLLDGLYEKAAGQMTATEKMMGSLQALVENLRQRIDEKDELMKRMKEDYQARIEAYSREIDSLRSGTVTKTTV